jgi:hypothetical protein
MAKRRLSVALRRLALLLVLTPAIPLFADTWAMPRPRVFASAAGTYGFKVLNPVFLRTATGLLFTLDEDGQETQIWQAELVNVPHRVFLPDDGKRVITIDTYGRLGSEHALVVYDEQGKVLEDYALDDLLTEFEIQFLVRYSVSSVHWAQHSEFTFSPDRTQFIISFKYKELAKGETEAFREHLNQIDDEKVRDNLREIIEEFDSLGNEPDATGREIVIDLESGKIANSNRAGVTN